MAEVAHLAIGDLARLTGTKVNTIRFYEEGGLLPQAERTAAGRRIYRDADDANWITNPTAYTIEKRDVKASESLDLQLAEGGGQAIHFVKK